MAQALAHQPTSATLDDAYQLFRLERQGNRVSPRTIEYYDKWTDDFFRWVKSEAPQVKRMADLNADVMRAYRAYLSARPKPNGGYLAAASLRGSHRALGAFLRWAIDDDQPVDPRILRIRAPRVPKMEKTVYHVVQFKAILAACNNPVEDLVVRLLVGSGVRASEACGLSLHAPDGLSDLMADSMERGRAELRVRWDAGAKGQKSRRVPISPQLAVAIRRYASKARPDVKHPQLLIGVRHRPFVRWGIDSMMDRLEARVGFRVHAHAFRHTFATVATQNDWNLEKLRAAMGHADYTVLQNYVSLASERDLGSRKEWAQFIYFPEITERPGW